MRLSVIVVSDGLRRKIEGTAQMEGMSSNWKAYSLFVCASLWHMRYAAVRFSSACRCRVSFQWIGDMVTRRKTDGEGQETA